MQTRLRRNPGIVTELYQKKWSGVSLLREGVPTSLLVSGVGVDVPQLVVNPGELQLVVTAANKGQENVKPQKA